MDFWVDHGQCIACFSEFEPVVLVIIAVLDEFVLKVLYEILLDMQGQAFTSRKCVIRIEQLLHVVVSFEWIFVPSEGSLKKQAGGFHFLLVESVVAFDLGEDSAARGHDCPLWSIKHIFI